MKILIALFIFFIILALLVLLFALKSYADGVSEEDFKSEPISKDDI